MYNIFKEISNFWTYLTKSSYPAKYSIKYLQDITKIAHEKYVEQKGNELLVLISGNILDSAKNGFYRFQTFETIDGVLEEYYKNINTNEWDNFIVNVKQRFSELLITINERYPYWINFDWSGDK